MDLRFANCPHCFAKKSDGTICQECGFVYNKINSQPDNVLPVFTSLNNRYLIGHCLGKGGFGITYSALDLAANVRCAIKEFYPSEFATRNHETNAVYPVQSSKATNVFDHAKERFLEEARLLYQLGTTPNIVRLYNFFSENNTAYIVMEFLDGNDLRRYTKNSGGRIPFEMAVKIIDSCSNALASVHDKGFLHRDISPDNIFVRNEKKSSGENLSQFVLIDFGAARNFIGNNAHTVLLKPGFAPPEAYSKTGNQGPWTDIYSLAASIYNVLSGQTIIDALYRARGTKQPSLYELGIGVPKGFSDAIENAMLLDFRKRPQNMRDFRKKVLDSCGMNGDFGNHMTIGTNGNSGNHMPIGTNGNSDNHVPIGGYSQHTNGQKYFARLTITDGPKKGNSIILHEGESIKIGRSMQSSDFILDYISEISRVHCTVSFNARERIVYLTDVSINGTYFQTNERLLKDKIYRLANGQKFYLVRRDCMIAIAVEEEVD